MKKGLKVFGASVKGPAHIKNDMPNQDAWMFKQLSFGSTICVCDGLGSREHSDVGAKMACKSVIEALKIWVSNDQASVNTLLQLVHTIWNTKIQPLSKYDCATTCLFAVRFNNGRYIFAQLGDGLIVGRTCKGNIVQIEPQEEDFTNFTTGLGIARSLSEWRVEEYDYKDKLQVILLCTDGISEDILTENRKDYIQYVVTNYVPLPGVRRWHKMVKDLKNWPTESHSDDKTLAVMYEDNE